MRSVNLLAALIIAGGLVLAATVFAFVGHLLATGSDTAAAIASARVERTLERQARQIETLDGEIAGLKAAIGTLKAEQAELKSRVSGVESRPAIVAPGPADPASTASPPTMVPFTGPPPDPGTPGLDQFGGTAPTDETEGLTDGMQLAKGRFNVGVQRPRPEVLRALIGEPRSSYNDKECQAVTNPKMMSLLETRRIGGFRLTMIKPALDSLEEIMAKLKRDEPDIYNAIGTAGALCARFVRGSSRSVSSHAWGAAVDLTMKKTLDKMGDGSTQFGLVVIAEYFNNAGWYWGAGYGREDSMHFEPGEALLRKWVAEGKL